MAALNTNQTGKSARVVTLADGVRVSLGAYVRAWDTIRKSEPEQVFNSVGFAPWPDKARNLLRIFREGMHDRINRHIDNYGKGRKWSDQWQRDTANASRRLNSPRLLVMDTEIPLWLRSRMSHRTHTKDDL